MAFRCNEFRRHNSEEEGEIGEEEGEIASPSRVPFDEPSANPTTSNTTMSASLTAMLPALSANNNNNNNNSSRSSPQLTTHLQAPQHNINTNIHREPRPPPDRGFRRPPNFAASTAGRGSGWQPRRPWPEHATDPGGIQRASSFTIRNNDSFRAMDPRNNQSTRPTDPRNPGAVEATSLNSQGGPTRPTDPRQISTLTHANVPGDSPHRSEQGTPHFHRSPSFTKPIRQLSVGGGRGHGPPGPSKSLSSGPPIRSASFANRTSHSISHRRESFTQQTRDTSFHRSGGEDPFRRTPEALDPFGRAPRSESSSSDTFGRTTETVDSFGRAPITSIERQHSAEGTFRPRANVDDSIFNRDEPGFNRHRPDNSGFNRPRLERHKSEPDETSFGGRGGGRGGRGNPRRFSSYSSLANDYGGPQRIDVPSHRSFDQSAAARSRLSPPTRISGLESPQKTVFVKQSSELSSDAVPRPPFSEGDPRKKAAEIRGYAPLQVQTMVRQESSGGNQPSAPDMKEGPLSSEQPQPLTLKLQDIQSSQQSSNVAFDRPGIRVSNVTLATPEAPDVCQATPTERRPTPISDSSTWSAPPLQQPFPRRDPRAPENRPKSRNIEPPRPLQLTCSSLGDPEIISRAEGAVKELSALVSSPALVENVGPSYLPTKQSIMKAMIMLDNKIKDCQAIAELADQTLSDAMKVENEEKELHEHQRVKEATSKKNRDGSAFKLDEEIQKRENGISELRSQLQNDIDVRRHALEGEKKEIGEASISCIKQSKSEVRKRKRTELKEQLEIAGQTFESDIEKAHREMQRHVCDAESADNKVAEAAQKYHTKRKESQAQSNHPHLQEEAGMCHLVSQIMKENRKRAAQAQEDSLAFLVVVESECIESVDPKHGKTNAEWTKLTREVTGLVDALYTEPSENPFFDQINDAHEWSGPVVKEYVRDRKRRLYEQWRELAEEYIVRKILYEKNMKKRGAIKGKSGSGAKVRSHRSSILGLDGSIAPSAALSESVDAGDNGGINRSSNNPYRRARRGHAGGAIGDVVRSEYEQEQIIAELTAKEAMEKRIAHGGSKLPRQICTVEKELTATYFNTFTHQRVSDPMEEAYQQSMSNLWTDMEKCIFLDRFMQHPKDFRKIASFLRNKTTSDCISYYYVSKQIVPYKHALKEHLMRRKRRGEYHNWDSTIQASLASGAIVAAGISEEKPLVFHLPWGDNTYHTYKLHPLRRDLLDGVDTSSEHIDEGALECVQAKRRRKQKDPWFILDVEQRKFLRQVEKETISSKTTLIEEQAKIPQTSSGSSVVSEQGGHVERDTPGRKAHKWTADEKRQFFDVIEKHGKNWLLLSAAVESKTLAQIKNYYYDHKKMFGSSRMSESHSGDVEGNQNQDDQDSGGHHSSDLDDDHDSGRLHHQANLYQHEVHRQHITAAESHHETTLANAELWAQAQLLKQQQEQAAQITAHEEARRYMQSHSQQQQQVLSSLSSMIPWMTAAQVAQAQVAVLQQQQHHHHLNASQSVGRDWDNDFLMRASTISPPGTTIDSSLFSPTTNAIQNMIALRQAHGGHQGFPMDAANQLRSMAALAGLPGLNAGNSLAVPSSSNLGALDVNQLERARAILEYRAGANLQADGLASLGLSVQGVGGPHANSSSAVDALGLLAKAVRRAEGSAFNMDGQQGTQYNDLNSLHQYKR